jgi:hypothetical protein
MKKIAIGALLLLSIGSCRNTVANYAERAAGVHKVCPTCNFVMSERDYYAVDTSQQPNIIYKVHFKNGGYWFKASDVDELVRIN